MASFQRGPVSTLVAFAALVPDAVHAEPPPPDDRGLVTLVIENDVFGEKSTDRNYTNGLKLAWMSSPGEEPHWVEALGRRLPGYERSDDVRYEFEIGQQIYTPEDLSRVSPDPNDRPYAGLLYGSLGMVFQTRRQTLDQIQLVAGVVGPSSGAEEVQKGFHRQIGAVDPKGWDTQIRDQFAGELRFQRTHLQRGGDMFAWSPHYGLTLGNLTTSANAGASFKFGKDLPTDFGPPRISPSLPGSGYFDPHGRSGVYLFGGFDARYVARNLVLDERSAAGAGVTREPWVLDGQLGAAIYNQRIRLAYTQVWRSPEFDQQTEDYTSFGAVSLTVRF